MARANWPGDRTPSYNCQDAYSLVSIVILAGGLVDVRRSTCCYTTGALRPANLLHPMTTMAFVARQPLPSSEKCSVRGSAVRLSRVSMKKRERCKGGKTCTLYSLSLLDGRVPFFIFVTEAAVHFMENAIIPSNPMVVEAERVLLPDFQLWGNPISCQETP